MNGADFIKQVRKIGRQRGVAVRFVPRAGKGSHGKLFYGARFTMVKDRKKEIEIGLLRSMAKQLGLDPKDIV